MTVSMDSNRNNKRRESWDSKMSSSSVVGRRLKRASSSALSSDSDIRFTRRKLGQRKRCGCLLVASFIGTLLLAAVVVYLAYTYLSPEPPGNQEFRVRFRVLQGDSFSPQLADTTSINFVNHARDYREMLNLLFRRSELASSFSKTEVLALDGEEDKDLVVHVSLYFEPFYERVTAEDVEGVLRREIGHEKPHYLAGLLIEPASLEVRESGDLPSSTAPLSIESETAVTPASQPHRRSTPLDVSYCNILPYNITVYPNLLGHKNAAEVQADMIAFRELVDAECYHTAHHFLCRLLQPECLSIGISARDSNINEEISIQMPCRSFCKDFWAGCGSRLSDKFRSMLDCNGFPEYSGPGSCAVKPGCADELEKKALSSRLCDGVPDCADLSDELRCSYCAPGRLHCGRGRACIAPDRVCDGQADCPDASDENSCLGIAPSLHTVVSGPTLTPHLSKFSPEGYVVFMERGKSGKLCAEGLKPDGQTIQTNPGKHRTALDAVATSLCRALTYKGVATATIVPDNERNVSYVRVENPIASEFTFIRSQCASKEVVYVGCKDLECGLQSSVGGSVASLAKLAGPGDWPWHAALFRDGSHVCDATLVAPVWLLTTAACFQGQPRAEWRARLGATRLISDGGPWQQERNVVGMVKSPVEGSTAALVRLETPVVLSNFIRPVCLPDNMAPLHATTNCNALGWGRHRKQLQRVQLHVSDMQRCENVSIATVNSLCTEASFPQQDCSEEEMAGSPMLCVSSDGKRWSLVGVSTWRIACAGTGATRGTERPRMYDKINSNVAWIQETIATAEADDSL